MTPAAPLRAMWLLAQLRLTRLRNVATTLTFRGKRKGGNSRVATPGKNRAGWILTLLMVSMMSFSFINMAHESVIRLHCRFDAQACQRHAGTDRVYQLGREAVLAELEQTPFSPALTGALTADMSILLLISCLLPLASRELSQGDWDLEWLVTLPVRRGVLLWGRLFERTLANPTGFFALLPLSATIAWSTGARWSAPLLGVAVLLPLLALAALLRTIVDTGLRMSLPASQLRNLQAVISLIGMPLMYLAISLGNPNAGGFTLNLLRDIPAWTAWTAPGLAVRLLAAHDAWQAAGLWLLMLAQVALLLTAGVALLRFQLRDGVVASGARESARKRAAPARAPDAPGGGWFWPRSAIKRRELRLLSRDRNFLVQSLVLPIVIVASQLLLNGRNFHLSDLGANQAVIATLAFGVGAYMLMLSAFQTLNNEGQVLWLLYTFPRSLESVLKEKAMLWGTMAMLYPLAVFGFGLYAAPAPDWRMLSYFVLVLTAMPLFATIAVALGVFGCDPLAEDVRTRVRPTYLYLFMGLASMYGYAIYTDVWSTKLVIIVLNLAMALALWQKARDQLPYLLDPAASPAARVSASDGLMAAMLFFVLQTIAIVLLKAGAEQASAQNVTLGFAIAGALVYGLTRLSYWRSKTADVPRIWRRDGLAPAAGWGVGLGLLAAVPGSAYLIWIQRSGLWHPATTPATLQVARVWLVALAVVAAPLFEEFIFRGLIFGGLRRSMGALPAMLASAAIFAIVHPPVSMLPVFVLGVCTAFAYERTRMLLAPMLVHAIYNAIMLAWQIGG